MQRRLLSWAAGLTWGLCALFLGLAIWGTPVFSTTTKPWDILVLGAEAESVESIRAKLGPQDRLFWVQADPGSQKNQYAILSMTQENPSWMPLPALAVLEGVARAEADRYGIVFDRATGPAPQLTAFQTAWVPVLQEERSGFEWRGLTLPERVRVGRTARFSFSCFSLSPTKARLRFWLGETQLLEKEFSLPAGESQFDVEGIPVEAGVQRFRAEAVEGAAAGRPVEIFGFVDVLGPVQVAIAGDVPGIQSALAGRGFEILSGPEAKGKSCDVLIVAGDGMDSAKILSEVQEGSGLVVFARESFSSGQNASLSDALPVTLEEKRTALESFPDPEQDPIPDPETEGPNRDAAETPKTEIRDAGVVALALLIDKSGSMAGDNIRKARESALATAAALHPEDELYVLAFDHEIREVLPRQKVKSIQRLRDELEKVQPKGGTKIFPALQEAARQLRPAQVAIRHIIVLTDGATEDALEAPYRDRIAEWVQEGFTLSTVGIRGVEYDTNFLSNLASWGRGRFYPVDREQIPQVITMETQRVIADGAKERTPETAKEQPRRPQKKPRLDPPRQRFHAVAGDSHPILQDCDWKVAPALADYWPAQPRLSALVPVQVQESGKPLLALGWHGHGKTAIWLADSGQDGSQDFFQSTVGQRLLAQLLEFIRRPDPLMGPWVFRKSESGVSWSSVSRSLGSHPGPFWDGGLGPSEHGSSFPVAGALRFWDLSTSTTPSLAKEEEQIRQIAARASLARASLIEESQIPSFLKRHESTQAQSQSWVWGVGALLGFLAAVYFSVACSCPAVGELSGASPFSKGSRSL